MPFERYLRPDVHSSPPYYCQDHRRAYDDPDCHPGSTHGGPSYLPHPDHHPHAIQFQIPQFMLNGPPILAPGGGAEVLPAGLLDNGPDSYASSWFSNNGFTPFHSTLLSRHLASGSASYSAGISPCRSFPSGDSQHPPPTYPSTSTPSVGPPQETLPDHPPSLNKTAAFVPNLTPSTSSPVPIPYSPSNALVPDSASLLPVAAPSTIGLPVYSSSGFDAISILSRVVTRPNPTVQLGPVDFSCSFVIVDVRRYDSPIVYASPTFCNLTGYSEQQVLGRNCRFLQSPTGQIAKGEPRHFSTPEAVCYMRKLLSSSKECQTTLVNYRKGGHAFINLITVIPLRGGVNNTPEEADEVAYHIGFQVDLTEQPNRILDKLRDGSYHNSFWGASNVASTAGLPALTHGFGQLAQAQNTTNIGTKGGRHGQMMSIAVSKELRNLIADATFTDSVPISTGTNVPSPTNVPSGSGEQVNSASTLLTMLATTPPNSTSVNRMPASGHTMAGSIPISLSPSLSLLLLEFLPDFLLVLSLKGAFLYVAPSVRLVLGYEPGELVGKSISDVCHPADLVPLMRELKDGSVTGLTVTGTGDAGSSPATSLVPKSVDLLFRALPKSSTLFSQTQEPSAKQGDFQPSLSSPASGSQSSTSSGAIRSHDLSDGTSQPHVWLECRGRLYVEPGKGRKAIILAGRARWMPVVRWSSVEGAGGLDSGRRHGEGTYGSPGSTTAGSILGETSSGEAPRATSINPSEFWALLSSQGTFLVASASVRDVLGWGTSEVIGRSILAMVRDSRSNMREHVEAELAKLDAPEVRTMIDPPPTVVVTSLVNREFHAVPMRLAFYRTPRSHKDALPAPSSVGAPTPLIHPLNSPLCPIVCQATMLLDIEPDPRNQMGSCDPSHGKVQINESKEPSLPHHPPGASLFEELGTARGSSWQYELQQLKFANQRLHEEVRALETNRGSGAASSSSTVSAGSRSIPFGQAYSSSPSPSTVTGTTPTITVPDLGRERSQSLHYTPLMHSAPSTSSSLRLPNSLHEQDPPSSEWSSLAGANGQGIIPLKRPWRSEDGPTT